jgi:hypothetical protein
MLKDGIMEMDGVQDLEFGKEEQPSLRLCSGLEHIARYPMHYSN